MFNQSLNYERVLEIVRQLSEGKIKKTPYAKIIPVERPEEKKRIIIPFEDE